jgi:hypothetical protein
MRTCVSVGLGLAASLVLGVAPGQSSESSNLDQHAQAVDRASKNAGSQHVAGRLASELNDSWGRAPGPYSAESLATQREQTGWGWGGVMIGNRLAQHVAESRMAANPTLTPAEALAQSLAAVTAARQAHTGWGVIAQENGVKLGALVSSVKQSTESVTRGLRSADKQGAKSIDRAAARGPALGTSERAARGAERSAKSDKARGGVNDFSNSLDSGHRSGGVAVSGPGVAGAAGHGGSGRGSGDKGGGPGANAGGTGQGGGNGAGGGPGGGGGQGGGNGGGGGGRGK